MAGVVFNHEGKATTAVSYRTGQCDWDIILITADGITYYKLHRFLWFTWTTEIEFEGRDNEANKC